MTGLKLRPYKARTFQQSLKVDGVKLLTEMG